MENICTGHPLRASEAMTAPESRAGGGTLQNTAFANTLAGGEEVSRTKVNAVNQVNQVNGANSNEDGVDDWRKEAVSKEEVIARLNAFPECPAARLKVQWFYKKRVDLLPTSTSSGASMTVEGHYRWLPFESFENTVLERAYQAGMCVCVCVCVCVCE